MQYTSTRDQNVLVSSAEAVYTGLSPEGGLYLPTGLPHFQMEELAGLSFLDLQTRILKAFFGDLEVDWEGLRKAYIDRFSHPDFCPLRELPDYSVLELYHGPTQAFKDIALTVLPFLIQAAHRALGRHETLTILTATSGDTGSASLEAFRDIPGFRICVFYPIEGVSPIQKRLMQTARGQNVHVCALHGNFDDAQAGVKRVFKNQARFKTRFSSANSINIGRLVPQMAYYFKAWLDLQSAGRIHGNEPTTFVVPSGNFGNILAGYLACLCGLPVRRLVCASNCNDVLTEFVRTGTYRRLRPFTTTTSPSMDILVSSNVERLLWYLTEGDSNRVRGWMQALEAEGSYSLEEAVTHDMQALFQAWSCSEEEVLQTIADVHEHQRYLLDPHSAVAACTARKYREQTGAREPVVVLSTASPYKFPSTVLRALHRPPGQDEFQNLKALETTTGVPIPENLRNLANATILHESHINLDEMEYYLKAVL